MVERIVLDCPWGKLDMSLKPGEEDFRGLLEHVIAQLTGFLHSSPNPEHTRRDLQGYKQVYETGCEKAAAVFFRLKWEAKEAGRPFRDNLAVVELLKKQGVME